MNTAELGILLKARDEASGILGNVKTLALGAAAALAGGALLAIKAAADEEAGINRLHQSLRNLGEGYLDATDGIEKEIAAWERSTAFSDGEMRDSLSLLIGMTGDYDESMKRLPIAMDLARGAGIDLGVATKLLGKLTDDNVGVLKKYGVTVKDGADATDVLAAVQAKFGGQAGAFAKSSQGQMTIFKNQVDNLIEDIGGVLLPIFTQGIQIATGFIDALRGGGQLEVIGQVFGSVTTILGELFGVITGSAPGAGAALSAAVGPEVAGVIMQGLATIRDTFHVVFGFISDVITAFSTGDMGLLQDSISEGSLTIIERFKGLAAALAGLVGNMLSALVAALPKIRDTLLEWATTFIKWVGPAALQLVQELTKLLGQVIGWLGDHAEDIGHMLVEWGLKFGEFVFTVAIPAILEHLPGILLAIGGWVLTEAIPGIIRIFFNLGKGIITGILEGLGELKTAIWNALVSAFSAIDFWVGPFHVSSGGITVQMPELHFPGFAEGGMVSRTGLALVHAGEQVLTPAQQAGRGGGGGGSAGVHVEVHGSVIGITDLEARVRQAVTDGYRSGGFRGVMAR